MTSVERADIIVSGSLVALDIIEPVPFDIESIDWDMSVTASPSSFSLYLHALASVKYLLDGYKSNPNESYLEYAKKIIESWIKYNSSDGNKNSFTWYSHSVASRVEVLIDSLKFEYIEKDKTLSTKIRELIIAHAAWLCDESHYERHHNHGIMEDIGLIACPQFIGGEQGEKYFEIAKTRVKEQLHNAFPNRHAHAENSTKYYVFARKLVNDLYAILEGKESQFKNEVREFQRSLSDFGISLYKPNLQQILLGDSYGADVVPKTITKEEYLSFCKKNALVSTEDALAQRNSVFLDDGYLFLRNENLRELTSESTLITFRSGYTSPAHKHFDDLSISMYSQGCDIFTDPGFINYEKNNVSEYFRQSIAHNTVLIDDKSPILQKKSNDKTKITEYREESEYDYARGVSAEYPGVEITRELYYFRNERQLLIIDSAISDTIHKYSQVFHLGVQVEMANQSKGRVILSLPINEYLAVIDQFVVPHDSLRVKGMESSPFSLLSLGMNKYIGTETIVNSWKGKSFRAITLVSIVKEAESNKKSLLSPLQQEIVNKSLLIPK